jgi:methylenetetrahydrofolate dehydrogenase (NADP+)/methenyltetrahydrofolate cyclohydrolase
MQLIDGRKLALRIREELKKDVAALPRPPKLGVILVGDDAASHTYVNLKKKAAHEAGILTDIRHLEIHTPESEILRIIEEWNQDTTLDGILVQLPLPEGYDTDTIIAAIDPKKDADGFHPMNVEQLLAGQGTIIPPVHEGILRLIAETPLIVNNARAVVIGNSEIFTAPLVHLLKTAGCIVTHFHPDELDRETLAKAHIIISAVGRPGLIRRGMVSADTCIIDVGTTRLEDGRIVGDVDAESLAPVEGWLSPVPGGVGPMTIAMLLKNVVMLARQQNDSK